MIERLDEAPYHVLPVVDGENRLLGIVDLEEVHLASQAPSLTPLILAADLMRSDVRPLDARRHSGPRLGTFRRERPAGAADRQRS